MGKNFESRIQFEVSGEPVHPCYPCPLASLAEARQGYEEADNKLKRLGWGIRVLISTIAASEAYGAAASQKSTALINGDFIMEFPCTMPGQTGVDNVEMNNTCYAVQLPNQ